MGELVPKENNLTATGAMHLSGSPHLLQILQDVIKKHMDSVRDPHPDKIMPVKLLIGEAQLNMFIKSAGPFSTSIPGECNMTPYEMDLELVTFPPNSTIPPMVVGLD